MLQSLSSEAKCFGASQEITRILLNPKVHYHTQNRPPPFPTLCQPNPVHIHPTTWRSISILHIHPPLGLPSGLFHSGFQTNTLFSPSPPPYVPHEKPISFLSILLVFPARY